MRLMALVQGSGVDDDDVYISAAAIEDTVAALDWLGDNARYCVDPSALRSLAFGGSSNRAERPTASMRMG